MALLTRYSDKRLLIIDDVPEVRSSLRSQVATLAIDKVTVTGTVRDALEHLTHTKFDIILCDYYLGGGTDGQQLLEYLRSRNLISRATLFVMITAEKSYESVVTAAECLPDDYLLKPFTAETVRSRLDRLLDKKTRLAKLDRLQDQGRWAEVIPACDEIIAARDKYFLDVMRIKGNALIMASRFDEAEEFYLRAIEMRPMPWAKLGLAKSMRGKGRLQRCEQTLNEIIAENPRFMAAYDLLGQVYAAEGRGQEALSVLDKASEVSPNSLARQRAIAGIAEDIAEYDRVEKALSAVVRKTRNTPLRESADYARLGNALAEVGEPARAVAVIDEGKASFPDAADARLFAAVEAVAQQKAGNTAMARQALDRALDGDASRLPEATAIAIARACFAHDRQDQGEALLKSVIQNDPDSQAIRARITNVMESHGAPERAEALIGASVQEVVDLNNEAVRKGQNGEFATAAQMLSEAADRLPGNALIVANAAFALLIDVYMNGIDAAKLRAAQSYLRAVQAKDERYPKLAEIKQLIAQIQRKYSLAADA